MKPTHISATDAARTFSDVVNRVRYRGEEFIIEKSGRPVCRIVPIELVKTATGADLARILLVKTATGADLARILSEPLPDEDFAEDVRKGIREQGNILDEKSAWDRPTPGVPDDTK
jgi:prevent-host-death family protein